MHVLRKKSVSGVDNFTFRRYDNIHKLQITILTKETVDDEKEYASAETHSEPEMVKAGSTAEEENPLRDMALNPTASRRPRFLPVTGDAYDGTLQTKSVFPARVR